jgi:hypothetical protein
MHARIEIPFSNVIDKRRRIKVKLQIYNASAYSYSNKEHSSGNDDGFHMKLIFGVFHSFVSFLERPSDFVSTPTRPVVC